MKVMLLSCLEHRCGHIYDIPGLIERLWAAIAATRPSLGLAEVMQRTSTRQPLLQQFDYCFSTSHQQHREETFSRRIRQTVDGCLRIVHFRSTTCVCGGLTQEQQSAWHSEALTDAPREVLRDRSPCETHEHSWCLRLYNSHD